MIIRFLLIIIALCSCHQPTTIKKPSAKVDKKDNETVFSTLDQSTILKRLFDDPGIDSNGVAIWKPNYYEHLSFPLSYDSKCHTAVDTIMYFNDSQQIKCAVALLGTYRYNRQMINGKMETSIGDCHYCPVLMGIALFSQQNDGNWDLYKFEKAFTTIGYYGSYKDQSAVISLKEIGDKWTCLSLAYEGGGNGGYYSGTENLFAIEKYLLNGYPNRVLSPILSYDYVYSSETEKKEVTTEMKIRKRKGDYYNIDLITTAEGKSITRHYKYADLYNCYREQGRP